MHQVIDPDGYIYKSRMKDEKRRKHTWWVHRIESKRRCAECGDNFTIKIRSKLICRHCLVPVV